MTYSQKLNSTSIICADQPANKFTDCRKRFLRHSLAHLDMGSVSHSFWQLLSSAVRLEENSCSLRFGWAIQGRSDTYPEVTQVLSWLHASGCAKRLTFPAVRGRVHSQAGFHKPESSFSWWSDSPTVYFDKLQVCCYNEALFLWPSGSWSPPVL